MVVGVNGEVNFTGPLAGALVRTLENACQISWTEDPSCVPSQ
jgi:hypothetical protein